MTLRPFTLRSPTPMPGWGLSFGIMLTMLSVVVLIPMAVLLWRGLIGFGAAGMWAVINRPRVWNALELSFRAALIASLFNLVFGVLLAWVLVRYRFPGKRIIDAVVDLPFALPTAVAAIALTAIYAPNGVFGSAILQIFGIRVAYSELGIWIALIFVGLPFVVRTVQPVIEEIDRETEEASATLGASRLRTLTHVVLPMLAPAALTLVAHPAGGRS
jgi:sulfate transport system permease protein